MDEGCVEIRTTDDLVIALLDEKYDLLVDVFQQGLSPDLVDEDGLTALMWISSGGFDEAIVDFLVNYGADVNFKDPHGYTALDLANLRGYYCIADRLLMFGAVGTDDPAMQKNMEAIYGGTYVGKFEDNIPEYLNRPKALLIATYEGEYDLVCMLLKQGCDPNISNEYGETAVRIAAEKGASALVKLLIDHGADVNIKDQHGDAPLDIAKYRNYEGVIKVLCESGAVGSDRPSELEQWETGYYQQVCELIQMKSTC